MLLPDSIQIGTIDYCNRKCPWCPESYLDKKPDQLMDMDTYKHILNDLSECKYNGRLHLYLMGEPLCDPRIREMISMARKQFPDNIIFLSTNGDKLNGLESVKSLIDSGLTWLAISDYDGQERFQKYVTEFYPHVTITSMEALKPTFYNRGGKIDVESTYKMSACEWVFSKAYINYKGEVILCCSDYEYEVVFGSMLEKSFKDIYNSKDYRLYRKAHMTGRGKELPLCDKCNRIA